jgi:hypothetical protein
MRTFISLCVVALIVVIVMAFATGVATLVTDHQDGEYVITLTVNTNMIHWPSESIESRSQGANSPGKQDRLDTKGKITEVRPEKNELVVSENIKNWTFELAKGCKIFVNDVESKLADLRAGDDATVTFDRKGEKLIATTVRATRK